MLSDARQKTLAKVFAQALMMGLRTHRSSLGAGPGVLLDTIVRRWQDHLITYCSIGWRVGEDLTTRRMRLVHSTVCDWHIELAALNEPLVDAMFRDAYESPYLRTDATGRPGSSTKKV